MAYSPILLFAYNRPEHTRHCVESLLRNELAAESDFFIYSDGYKSKDDEPLVKQVRTYASTVSGFRSVTVVERETNYGLARNIIEGVTEATNRYGRAIMLEDDLVLSPHFLRFMNDALETYKDEPAVGHIHAWDYVKNPALPETFLIKWTGSCGWATWKRAWELFNPDGRDLLRQLEERNLTRTFDFDGTNRFTRMLRRYIAGKNNSWAIRWNASLFLADVLSLQVGRSLVVNEGFDGTGTNSGKGQEYASRLYDRPIHVSKITPAVENKAARAIYTQYYRNTTSLKARIIRRLKRTLHGDFGR